MSMADLQCVYADTPEKARHYLEIGVDCILTNDYQRISAVVKEGF